ncbi:MAG TPA: hypothetical protein VMQ61_16440 [Thermoanaerobaculia bacterium]|nr:hypothetical protein [Thermoanaerobaculia bacterium]
MKARGRLVVASLVALCSAATVFAQETAAPPTGGEKEAGWEFNASVYGYFPPDDRHYAQPTVIADHGALHLEGRYNYESFKTGSAWVGWNFGLGEEDKFRLDATLMAGGVFGDTHGVAPGLELTATYGRFELYSESEYVIDVDDSANNFFYNWAQLGYSPLDWLTVGLSSQRTRAYHAALDVQRGFFVGFTYKSVKLTTYVFNPGWETPTVVSSLAVSF